jgi:hypothetical protein
MNLPAILEHLQGRPTGNGKGAFRCPAHDDRRASGTIGIGDDGRILLHCQAGCAVADILSASGLEMRDLFPERAPRRTIVATYDYVSESAELLYQVVRFAPKDFRQRRPYEGTWCWGLTAGLYEQRADGDWYRAKNGSGRQLPAVRRVLYRLPELLAGKDPVFVVEGEKDADNVIRLGLTATTNVGGAGKWMAEYSRQLAGRRVFVLPDNDPAGEKHAAAVGGRVVRLPGLRPKGDVSDWIAAGGAVEELLVLVEQPAAPPPPPPAPTADGSTPAVTDEAPRRPLSSRSYHTAVTIIGQNRHNVLEGRVLEFNDMTGKPTLNRRPLEDVDAFRIRYLIEDRFEGAADGKGMRIAVEDIRQAIIQVAFERRFHPVRDYLSALHWDGRERIKYLPDLIGAERSTLNQTLLRRWMISGVARPLSPGCQVHTVLILVGRQGTYKSTFFRIMAGEWFVDTAIDIHNRDAFLTLARAWILEWAELESMLRARDAEAVKAFLTSAVDTYRRPFGHFDVEVPRTGIIVGSTNREQFLSDDMGEERRYWPITIAEVDIDTVTEQRDQLWAEAVAAFRTGEKWYLNNDERQLLAGVHAQHRVADAWEPVIVRWTSTTEDFTTADVLEHALKKPTGQWTRADEMRVGRVLRTNGWETSRPHRGARLWRRSPS